MAIEYTLLRISENGLNIYIYMKKKFDHQKNANLNNIEWAWWHVPVIPSFGRLRQEDCHRIYYITSLI